MDAVGLDPACRQFDQQERRSRSASSRHVVLALDIALDLVPQLVLKTGKRGPNALHDH
jgi:hypothetical protein